MHQKKSELQIGKESSCIASDFNPTPPLFSLSSSLHQKHHQISNIYNSTTSSSSDAQNYHTTIRILDEGKDPFPSGASADGGGVVELFVKLRTLLVLSRVVELCVKFETFLVSARNSVFCGSPFGAFLYSCKWINYLEVLHRLRFFRRLVRYHLRLILLLALPFLYFLISHPTHAFVLDFLFAFSFSAAFVVSVYLALPKLPLVRLFLARSLPIKLNSSGKVHVPVFWSIGSRPKLDKKKASGCWVQGYNNGDVYEGEFHKGKCSGNGVYYYYLKGRYEGDWVDGKYDGYGVETWARGSRYRGQYSRGLKHGYGVYRFYTGDVYSGEWSNGQSHGNGVHTCEDGSRYVGEFKGGVKHGLGHYHFRNGDTYAGEYFADKMHGFGVYRFANGHCYEGAWHDGKRQGIGMYTFRNGEVQSGHWKGGVLHVPSTQNTSYPIAPVGIYHSKVLNAVQEARGAAEKAYDVGKVDERVNRAVIAANRAANAARVTAVNAVVHKQMDHHADIDELPYPLAA